MGVKEKSENLSAINPLLPGVDHEASLAGHA